MAPADGHLPSDLPTNKSNTSALTTNAGGAAGSNLFSVSAGRRGPVLLEDFGLLEKLAQFDRERIPERVVHARGMTAKGYFEVTNDLSKYTAAAFLQKKGDKTPVAARFSTVVHERGSPETLRDVRGFSVKFYTSEGNWDFVGNNIPVFFIRDGISFPDLVHSLKPNPRNHLQEGWRVMDFLSHHPEATHILTWLLDDNGIPANWRTLEGYGVHTFILVNADGKETFVKFHWRPKDGAKFLMDDETDNVGATPSTKHSHATEDLTSSIEKGDFPEWTFYVQLMDPSQQIDYEFDVLDATKYWPEDQFPLIEVGRMVLDENVSNFHNESEMIAFSPGVTVNGIEPSNDKLLQSRIMSYSDAQRYRLGVNYLQLPVNAPKCPYHNNHNEGTMNMTQKDEEVNYWPSKVEHTAEAQAGGAPNKVSQQPVEGDRVQADLPNPGSDFKQAGERIRSWDDDRRARFCGRLVSWLAHPKCAGEIRDTWIDFWSQCDASFGKELQQELAAQ